MTRSPAGPAATAERALAPDFGALALWHRQSFPEDAWDSDTLEAFAGSPGVEIIVGALHGAPAGFVMLRTAADESEIITICVEPQARGRGVGAALVAAAASRARAQGAIRLILEAAEDNGDARRLYSRAGFAKVGVRRGYYARPGFRAIDALILALDL